MSLKRQRESNGSERPPEKRVRTLPEEEIALVVMELNDYVLAWKRVMSQNPDEANIKIFLELARSLSKTTLGDAIIDARKLSEDQTSDIMNGFSPTEKQLWDEGCRAGLEKGDWGGLVQHRTLYKLLQITILIPS